MSHSLRYLCYDACTQIKDEFHQKRDDERPDCRRIMGKFRRLRAVHHGTKPDVVAVSDHDAPDFRGANSADALFRSRRQRILHYQKPQGRHQPADFFRGRGTHRTANLPADHRKIQRRHRDGAAIFVTDHYRGVVLRGAQSAAGGFSADGDLHLAHRYFLTGHPR